MIILLIDIVSAATIHGTVYSFDLEEITNAIVKVDSEPVQTMVSKDGTYSFELEPGDYIITATYSEDDVVKDYVTENINIEKQGTFVLDLILFPSFAEEEELLKETEEEIVDGVFEEIKITDIIIFCVAIVGFGVVIYLLFRYRKILVKVTEEVEKAKLTDDLERKVLDFIKKEKGRVTQKEIRKQFPMSEAKISLVISDLESKNIIKKIKKGRGNIVVLQ